MPAFIIRADGSTTLGMGHITRCLAVAYVLRTRGNSVTFLCKTFDDRLEKRIREEGHSYHALSPDLSMTDDAAVMVQFAKKAGAQGIVVDLSNTLATHNVPAYTNYLAQAANALPTLIIDDLTHAVFPRATVVVPNTGSTDAEYDTRYKPLLLIGSRYALLHPAFSTLTKRSAPTGPVRHVVIALGGGKAGAAALHPVLDGLSKIFDRTVEVHVVAGLDDEYALKASALLKHFHPSSALHTNIPHLAHLLSKADLAIVSGGVTKFEAAAAGAAIVMVAMVEHQERWAASLADTGAALYAGPASQLTPESIAGICRTIDADIAVRQRMVAHAVTLVDGLGAERSVTSAFPQYT